MRKSYINYFKDYLNVRGRTNRRSFLNVMFINICVAVLLCIFFYFSIDLPMRLTVLLVMSLFLLLHAIPTYTLCIRRLHDVARHAYIFILYSITMPFVTIFYYELTSWFGISLKLICLCFTIYFIFLFSSPTKYELIDRRHYL